jgi:hypothetical protein
MNDIEQPRDALSMGTAFTFAFLNAHTRPADPSRERLTLSLANGDSAKETNVYISSNYPAFSGIITKISPRDKLLVRRSKNGGKRVTGLVRAFERFSCLRWEIGGHLRYIHSKVR